MPRATQKLQIFILGLTIGLLAGGLFFILKLDDYFTQFSFSTSKNNASITEEKVENVKERLTTETGSVLSVKKTKMAPGQPDTSLEVKATLTASSAVSAESITVLTDELISVKNITVKDLNPSIKNSNDSLLAALSDIQEPSKTDFFMIEFWKTPLNSKGYKMSRHRLLLYGLQENADLSIIKHENNYYLRNNIAVYRLDYTADFRPLEKVADDIILEKFN